ncbi:tripartite tricarboxylate transporter substrate binding protein [Bradyrhizobium sp. LHD-71]|uniref:Bug family tripartite tricarboxylate transporter substrate binding protein n=1 Tax=Bradyrhizobium sp. LHD-71 TaxID=3072141 RepID=UPI00280CEDA0|nr:tripartite tricarboxylate transporter substrate binding protein [Bradyrhizobium sp. LHD-71]MDQ8726218.1 tripartite tricarboxylate transporter substrate binding protein [Bradyrhizobium sp. LHD-71]
MKIFSLVRRSLPAVALALAAFGAQAQDNYPNRAIRLIVPYTPGASTDAISRAFADEASKVIGQPIVVENRGGAGTAIGTQTARNAPADGYTLLFGSGTMISTMLALKEPGYTMKDFTPVTMLGDQYYVLLIPKALPVTNAKEFVEYAKKNPSKMNYGMLGQGSPSHVLADRFARSANFQWQDIAFRGGTPTLTALMSNDVQGYFATQTFATTYLNSDKVRLLAIGAEERGEFLPDVPTFKELGYNGVVEQGWYALFVRSETPKEIVEKLRKVSAEVMASAAMKGHLKTIGLSPYKGTMDSFLKNLDVEIKQKAEETKRLGIVPQ